MDHHKNIIMKAEDKGKESQKQPPRSMSADQGNYNKYKSNSSATDKLNSKHHHQHGPNYGKGKGNNFDKIS